MNQDWIGYIIIAGASLFALYGFVRRAGLWPGQDKPDCGCGRCAEKRKTGSKG